MKFILGILLAITQLAGCANLPEPALQPRDQVRDFALEARFALRSLRSGEATQSSGGRLSWMQANGHSHLLISNPIGIGIAEIEIQPGRAVLHASNGETRQSDNPDQLIEEVTGHQLPVTRMADWLLGHQTRQSKIQHDFAGRPQHLEEAGWRVDYHYEVEAVDALPSRLTIVRDGEIELRLRIETWKPAP